jgi:hypothetical protein
MKGPEDPDVAEGDDDDRDAETDADNHPKLG